MYVYIKGGTEDGGFSFGAFYHFEGTPEVKGPDHRCFLREMRLIKADVPAGSVLPGTGSRKYTLLYTSLLSNARKYLPFSHDYLFLWVSRD